MTKRDNILKELQELKSGLAEISLQTTYQAPVGYFDGLADEILKKIRAIESTNPTDELENLSFLLSGIPKKMPHSVPEGYFDELGKKLEEITVPANEQNGAQEPEGFSPLLSDLKNKPTYTIPVSYFESLPALITKKISTKEAKLVSVTSRKWFRYAAAAVVIGFVATIGFLLLGKKDIDPENKSYAWVKKNLKKVSTDDITKFVELATAETTDLVKLDTKDEISNLLKDVSDKEIQEFLNDTQAAESTADEDLILN